MNSANHNKPHTKQPQTQSFDTGRVIVTINARMFLVAKATIRHVKCATEDNINAS